tara:strand:- start:464 stop:1510 length:1047 start_codon:yes stop_codon:yes gene_type:complete
MNNNVHNNTNKEKDSNMSNLQVVNNDSNITESNLNPEMEINSTVDLSSAISEGSEVLEQSRDKNTAGNIDPFRQVVKIPQVDKETGYHFGNYNMYFDDDRKKSLGSVSEQYLIIDNKTLSDRFAEARDKVDGDWKLQSIWCNGSQFREAWVKPHTSRALASVGATLEEVYEVTNSYNGTLKAAFMRYARILECENGWISKNLTNSINFSHRQNNIDWASQVDKFALAMVGDGSKSFMDSMERNINKLAIDVDSDMLALYRNKYLDVKSLGDGVYGQMMTKYFADNNQTLFGLAQAGTYITTHRDKIKKADFDNNSKIVDSCIAFADDILSSNTVHDDNQYTLKLDSAN